jgi:hypothetical protein
VPPAVRRARWLHPPCGDAGPRAIGSPHRPTSHDVRPSPARKKGLVSLTLPYWASRVLRRGAGSVEAAE